LYSNDFSKHNIYKTKKKLSEGLPLLKKNLEIKNNYSEVKIIRDKVRNFLKNKKITIPTKPRLEISHHYGIEKFYKFGITMITVINKIYCKKLIIILPNQKHPAQFHKKKQESFFILYGKVNLKINKKNLNLNPGDLKTIKPGEIHEFSSKTGAIIEELSTTSMINDSFYIDKSIHKNKNRKSFITL
jgi:D-lyxose ketol-isomerase